MPRHRPQFEPVVITGIGLTASVGENRESVWRAVREGRSAMRKLDGLPGIPDGMLIGAPVDIESARPGELKVFALCDRVADEGFSAGNPRRKLARRRGSRSLGRPPQIGGKRVETFRPEYPAEPMVVY